MFYPNTHTQTLPPATSTSKAWLVRAWKCSAVSREYPAVGPCATLQLWVHSHQPSKIWQTDVQVWVEKIKRWNKCFHYQDWGFSAKTLPCWPGLEFIGYSMTKTNMSGLAHDYAPCWSSSRPTRNSRCPLTIATSWAQARWFLSCHC